MSNSPLVLVNLIIISSFVSLVSEEMDLLEVLSSDVRQSEGLVPSVGAVVLRNGVNGGRAKEKGSNWQQMGFQGKRRTTCRRRSDLQLRT